MGNRTDAKGGNRVWIDLGRRIIFERDHRTKDRSRPKIRSAIEIMLSIRAVDLVRVLRVVDHDMPTRRDHQLLQMDTDGFGSRRLDGERPVMAPIACGMPAPGALCSSGG